MNKPILTNVAVLLLCIGVSACASVPDAHKMIAQAEEESSPPVVVGTQGPLTATQSRILLIKRGATDALLQHLAVEQTLAKVPLVAGNSACPARR